MGNKFSNRKQMFYINLKIIYILIFFGQVRADFCNSTGYLDTDYRGYANLTVTGRSCQKWTVLEPHKHPFYQEAIKDLFTPEKTKFGLGDHNFCRNPDGKEGAWCYTTSKGKEWEYCFCSTQADYNCTEIGGLQSDYDGNRAVTASGLRCQKWSSQSPHQHNHNVGNHNFCRDPSNSGRAWCFTTNKKIRWETCSCGDAYGVVRQLEALRHKFNGLVSIIFKEQDASFADSLMTPLNKLVNRMKRVMHKHACPTTAEYGLISDENDNLCEQIIVVISNIVIWNEKHAETCDDLKGKITKQSPSHRKKLNKIKSRLERVCDKRFSKLD